MPDFPTFNDLFRVARDEVLLRNGRISRDAVERDGMDANILLAAACAAGDEVIGQLAELAAGMFLDSAEDEALDRLAFDRYGLVRKSAAASLGTAQFSTTVGAPVTFTIPSGTLLRTADGREFITTQNVIFTAGTVGPLATTVRSVLAGSDQNAKSGSITSITSSFPSRPADLVVVNPFATAGGDSTESNDSLRERARRYFTTVRRGTLGALEEAALGVPGVRSAAAFEVVDALGRPARLVQLVVSDAFTEQFALFDTVPPRYEVQSQYLSTLVFNALSDARPAGVYVQVQVATVILQAVQLSLTFSAGVDVQDAALRARAAVVNYMNGLSPGAAFNYDAASAKLRAVSGLLPSGSIIASPPGNVAAKPLQVLRTSLGLVAATAAQNDQPVITGTNPDAYTLAGA
jgi:uncharacterized phage protein gp47/JayE